VPESPRNHRRLLDTRNHPHEIQRYVAGNHEFGGLRYIPRQDGGLDGTGGNYEIYTSRDCASCGAVPVGA
jgi:hypothetical protein